MTFLQNKKNMKEEFIYSNSSDEDSQEICPAFEVNHDQSYGNLRKNKKDEKNDEIILNPSSSKSELISVEEFNSENNSYRVEKEGKSIYSLKNIKTIQKKDGRITKMRSKLEWDNARSDLVDICEHEIGSNAFSSLTD